MADVGVVMTSHDQRETLAGTVASVLAQDDPPARVVVVDDGSDDPDALADVLPMTGVEVLRQENRGVSAARNAGAAALDTELVAVLDGDDEWDSAWLRRVVPLLDGEGVVAASSWLATTGAGRWTIRPEGGDATAFLTRNAAPASVVLRRDRWAACGGWDETLRTGFEDWDFALRLLEGGGRIAVLPEALLRYRTAPASLNLTSTALRTQHVAAVLDRHAALVARHHRAALLELDALAKTRLDLLGRLLERHPEEPVEPLLTFGDGGMATAVAVQTARDAGR